MHIALLLWSLSASSALADPAEPAPAADACADPLPALIEAVRIEGDKRAYLCLVQRDEAGSALMTAAAAGGAGHERVTRALAVWRMPRLDERIPDDEARTYNPADRRLLRDAVQARRGRASPVPENAEIFAQFDWYKPDPHYTTARLDDLDRVNLGLVDKPPEVPKPVAAPAAEAMAEAPPAPPADSKGCGCAAMPSAKGAGFVLFAGMMLALRRRSRGSSAS